VARASSAETVANWSSGPAADLWIVLGASVQLSAAVEDGAAVRTTGESTSFAVFNAMRTAGVDDVRRVGVEAARRAGAGAVVGIADDPRRAAELLASEPDAVVAEGDFDGLYHLRYGSDRPFRPQVLLNPGPALTTDAVKRAAAGVDLCHREEEFTLLDEGIRAKLLRVAEVGADWRVAIMSGSGTCANEMAMRAAVRPGRRALVVVNGVYGERLRSIAGRAGIGVVVNERR